MMLLPVHATTVASQNRILKFGPYIGQLIYLLLLPFFPFPFTLVGAQLAKNLPAMWGRPGFDPWVGKFPWRRERLPAPVFWPEELHGLYPELHGGHKELDMSDLHFHYLFNFLVLSNMISEITDLFTPYIFLYPLKHNCWCKNVY